ncbi:MULTISPECIES: PGPGW domain-containing protein [Thalassotalea]|uniref:PGPGW domain-containing protein n=1 Tax=Thalassotalea TaxID=1518149 RepID=UPI000AF5C4AC|nr:MULTISPECIES: PGPGW domain-containing protein [Thalassotalea]
MKRLQSSLMIIGGFIFLLIGLVFILLPGPAVIFIPLGLAMLSTKYVWAQQWLKRSQRWLRKRAVEIDRWLLKRKYRG